jgi:hypothetical protein
MTEGLEILLARMETDWDEFVNGEWDGFLQNWGHVLKEEDQLAIEQVKAKMIQAKLDRERKLFSEAVLQKIINNNEQVGRWTYKWVKMEERP